MVHSKKPSLEPIVEYKAEELVELTEKAIEKQGLQSVNEAFSKAVGEAIIKEDYEAVGTIIDVASVCQVMIDSNIESKEKGK